VGQRRQRLARLGWVEPSPTVGAAPQELWLVAREACPRRDPEGEAQAVPPLAVEVAEVLGGVARGVGVPAVKSDSRSSSRALMQRHCPIAWRSSR
jgi:hypothetical protein